MAMYLEDMKMITAISVNSCLQQWDLTLNSSGQEQFLGSPPNVGLLGPFIREKIRRALHKMRTVPFIRSRLT